MADIFTLDNFNDFSEKINIDELYEKKRQSDLVKLEIFNKILHRIHVRIKTVSRQKIDNQYCWYLVPEVILGVPKYDQGACIAYLMDKLKLSGFNVRYVHPNVLFISWLHWVPSYVRSEIKKKTGISINEYGEKIDNETEEAESEDPSNIDNLTRNLSKNENNSKKPRKEYTPIQTYKPSGNLLYPDDILEKINNRFK